MVSATVPQTAQSTVKTKLHGNYYNTGISGCVDFFIDLTSIQRPWIEFDKLIEVTNFNGYCFTEVILITNTRAHKAVYVRNFICGM